MRKAYLVLFVMITMTQLSYSQSKSSFEFKTGYIFQLKHNASAIKHWEDNLLIGMGFGFEINEKMQFIGHVEFTWFDFSGQYFIKDDTDFTGESEIELNNGESTNLFAFVGGIRYFLGTSAIRPYLFIGSGYFSTDIGLVIEEEDLFGGTKTTVVEGTGVTKSGLMFLAGAGLFFNIQEDTDILVEGRLSSMTSLSAFLLPLSVTARIHL